MAENLKKHMLPMCKIKQMYHTVVKKTSLARLTQLTENDQKLKQTWSLNLLKINEKSVGKASREKDVSKSMKIGNKAAKGARKPVKGGRAVQSLTRDPPPTPPGFPEPQASHTASHAGGTSGRRKYSYYMIYIYI